MIVDLTLRVRKNVAIRVRSTIVELTLRVRNSFRGQISYGFIWQLNAVSSFRRQI